MSIYIGAGSSGKKQLHLTNNNPSETTMKGGPTEGTTFHSDLPYITILDTIHTYENSSRRNLIKSYMDQGYVYKRVYRGYTRGGESWMPGSTATFRTSVGGISNNDRLTMFISLTKLNPSRGWGGGNRCFGPPEAWSTPDSGLRDEGAFLAVDGINFHIDFSVGYSGGYIQGVSNDNVELRSNNGARAYQGSATIRGIAEEYEEADTYEARYDPWSGDLSNGGHKSFLILNIKKDSDGYDYTNLNNDPGTEGIRIDRTDITVGSNYSMKDTAVLADLGGSGGTVGWNTSSYRYVKNVPYLRSNDPKPDSALWNFFNETYKVGTQYTKEMDEVCHIMYDLWIFVNDSNTIVGWQIKPGIDDCLVNVHPSKLLGAGAGLEVTNDTIKMSGSDGKELTVASPSTDLLQLPADPVNVVVPAITNYKYSQIRSGMSAEQAYSGSNDTWVNRGATQRLYTKTEVVGSAPFPPSLRGSVDSARVMLDFKWGAGTLGVTKGGYVSAQTIDHKIVHSPMLVFHIYRTPGVTQGVASLFQHCLDVSQINTYAVGASTQPTNDSNNKYESVTCSYYLSVDWDNEIFLIYRKWWGCSGNYYWSYYSYNQTIYSKVYAFSDGDCRYYIPECKVGVYVLSATDNNYSITPKP